MLPVGSATSIQSPWHSRSPSLPTSSKPSSLPAIYFTMDLHYSEEKAAALQHHIPRSIRCCSCGRRHLLGSSAAAFFLPTTPWKPANSLAVEANGSVKKFNFARPDWYEEFFAKSMVEGMRSYEAQIAGYKEDLFNHFTEMSMKVLELGVGTGPNFKYYARTVGLHVVGVDPNKQMEKYARDSAVRAGLPQTEFTFMQGIGEYLPVEDGSMDAVIGTLVLCSVKDVNRTLQEVRRVLKTGGLYFFIEHVAAPGGSLLRFTQSILDPLQQFVADGCHLTQETGVHISRAGFSSLTLNEISVPTVSIISPHVYGIACK